MNHRQFSGIQAIRPKVLFKAIETRFPEQNVGFMVNIPSPDIGGTTLLEASILVSLLKLSHAKRVFEFGTYMGASTLLFAQNTPDDAQIVTLDLPLEAHLGSALGSSEDKDVLVNGNANDDYLRHLYQQNGARCVKRAHPQDAHKVKQLYADSMTLDVHEEGLAQQFDFIFIDGGHHYDIVKADTLNAYQMLKPDGIVVWHDYASSIHTDVTTFLGEHAAHRNIFHVEHTMIAFELIGQHQKLLEQCL